MGLSRRLQAMDDASGTQETDASPRAILAKVIESLMQRYVPISIAGLSSNHLRVDQPHYVHG